MSKTVPIAIVAAIIGVALSVLIPMWRGAPQMTEQAQIESAAQIEAARNNVEYGPPAPAQQGVLFDLRAAGKIAADVSGFNIEQVSLNVLNLTDEPIRVHIPAGTFFAANDAGAQSMVATSGDYIDLGGRQARSASIATACANLPLDIPDRSNSFTIAQAPPQPELAQVAARLANENYDVRQAAVWIITDNADYGDLGILVTSSSYGNFGGVRVIDPEDAVSAMQIIDAAGVNIRARRIWGDRAMLLETATPSDARTWLDGAG